MNKIKVLEVIRQGQIGGGESHLLDLVTFLDKEQFEPVCLAFTPGDTSGLGIAKERQRLVEHVTSHDVREDECVSLSVNNTLDAFLV